MYKCWFAELLISSYEVIAYNILTTLHTEMVLTLSMRRYQQAKYHSRALDQKAKGIKGKFSLANSHII